MIDLSCIPLWCVQTKKRTRTFGSAPLFIGTRERSIQGKLPHSTPDFKSTTRPAYDSMQLLHGNRPPLVSYQVCQLSWSASLVLMSCLCSMKQLQVLLLYYSPLDRMLIHRKQWYQNRMKWLPSPIVYFNWRGACKNNVSDFLGSNNLFPSSRWAQFLYVTLDLTGKHCAVIFSAVLFFVCKK